MTVERKIPTMLTLRPTVDDMDHIADIRRNLIKCNPDVRVTQADALRYAFKYTALYAREQILGIKKRGD